ncbi:MAG: GGDEF domain-containing protein [Clostridia bacterium]|nr:GGDEF domain-containing protein [Clostridia bacterium]
MANLQFDSFTLVVNSSNYKIVSCSKEAKRAFPNLTNTDPCYKIFHNFSRPCISCPLHEENKTIVPKVLSNVTNITYDVRFSNTDNENEYLVTCYNSNNSNDDEFKVFTKSEIFNRASYNGAYAYFVLDLNEDIFVTSFYEVIDLVESETSLEGIYGLKKPYSFSTFAKWRLDKRVVSNKYEFERMVNSKALIELYNRGETYYEIHYDCYSSGGYPAHHHMSYNLRKDDTTGHIMALCIMRDITAKLRKEAEYELLTHINNKLLDRYSSVFILDTDTQEFRVIKADEITGDAFGLKVNKKYNFSSTFNEFISEYAHHDDIKEARLLADVDNILSQLKNHQNITKLIRIRVGKEYRFYEYMLSKLNDEVHARQIVISVSDVHDSICYEKEQQVKYEQAVQLAQNDVMTGVKNRTAYDMKMQEIDRILANHEKIEFCVVMFDINFLKQTNDVYGHDHGDKLIIKSAELICDVFSHSPVYRIGGDEFVAILTGKDYKNREDLVFSFKQKIKELSNATLTDGDKVSIACGSATYYPSVDKSFSSVATRADIEMYENKNTIKEDATPEYYGRA